MNDRATTHPTTQRDTLKASRLIQFKPGYLILALALFATEVLIALYCHGGFIRFHFGDVLVVMLMYCAVRAVANFPITKTALGVLLFAYAIELSQHFQLVHLLGLESSRLARVVLGSRFGWDDLLCYTAGVGIILGVESLRAARHFASPSHRRN